VNCMHCGAKVYGVYPIVCDKCGYSIDYLSGVSTSAFQQDKFWKHTEISRTGSLSIGKHGPIGSFTMLGVSILSDMVRYALTYGSTGKTTNGRGDATNFCACYFPEVIGSGILPGHSLLVPCSGLMIISPQSQDWGHPFPMLDEWQQKNVPYQDGRCQFCNKSIDFGQTICQDCYHPGFDWRTTLREAQ